jgi:ribonuclease Z
MKNFAAMLVLWVCCACGALAQQPDFKVTLLGTGSPPPVLTRFGPSVLVQAGKETLLIDCGRGCSQRLWQGNVKLSSLDGLFITHLHSDHIVGIPDLWLTGWLVGPYGQRRMPFRVWGPVGTKTLMEHLEKAYLWDIDTRVADQKLPREGVAVVVAEFVEGVVYERNGVRVTAFEVDHGDLVKPAFGYRVDYDGRSVVISGDTKFNENLIRHATGADLLIHQVAMARTELIEKSEAARLVLSHHTKPEEAGLVFTRAAPKLAVYYHVSLLGSPDFPPLTEKDVIDRTRTTYSGPLEMGRDMMVFVVGKDGVKKQ